MIPFDLRKYSSKKIWFTISQVDQVTSPLRNVFQKHEDLLMKSLKSNKYRYGVGLLNVASPISGRLGAVKFDDVRKHRGTSLFLSRELALAIVVGRHSRPCTQTFADSGEPRIK